MSQSLLINPTAFEAGLESAFLAGSPPHERCLSAFERFAKTGLPHRRMEGWKWSDFNSVLRNAQPHSPDINESVTPSVFSQLSPLEFRIINGRIEIPEEELPEGLRYGVVDAVGTIPELERHPIATLNVAMTKKALGIEVAAGIKFDRPILIRHINNGVGVSFAQSMMRVSESSSVQIIETYEGDRSGLYSHLFHLAVRDNAIISRAVFDQTGANAVTHAICAAKVDEAASYNQTSLSTGGKLSRHETIVHFWGSGGEAKIDSALLLSGERHGDFTTHVLHKQPDCTVRQLHKGVAADKGRAVFQGKFEVERAAQKTDAQMTANALLLSGGADANHKPELEIYADDVECAHGSTCGALDDNALFYLRQRGLSENQARALLIEAFVGEVIDQIEAEEVRAVFSSRVAEWLEQQS